VSYAKSLGRRDFLRGAVVMAGTAYAGVATSQLAHADTGTTLAWQLDPSWGYPKGARGRTSCHCRACLTHAANKIFSTESAAEAGVAHAGCLCVPFSVEMDPTIYDALFVVPHADVVDRRDPDVEAILDPAPIGTFDAFSPDKGQVGHQVVLKGSQLTGTTRVMFGRLPAQFAVDSSTQITATHDQDDGGRDLRAGERSRWTQRVPAGGARRGGALPRWSLESRGAHLHSPGRLLQRACVQRAWTVPGRCAVGPALHERLLHGDDLPRRDEVAHTLRPVQDLP
jgi:hypothetical protein